MEGQRGEYWEMEEYGSEENDREKVSWVLDKRIIGLGKKILFTGLVISTAPLTLPPLMVISAIGLVVSIPSGIFLASYCFSERLMRKLLPIPDQEEEEEEEEEETDKHRGLKRKTESEDLEDRNVDFAVEENGVVGKDEVEESDERLLEEPVVIEEIIVEEIEPGGGEEEVVQVTTVVVVDEKSENSVEEKESENEIKGLAEETKDEGKTADENKTPQEISTSKDDQSAISTTKGDESAFSTTTELPLSQGAEETKNQAGISSEKADQTTPSNNEAKKKKNVKKKPVASQQPQTQKVLYDEQGIWEQIEAVRKIVGYKATLQKTSIEELKALYIFTGVEPPASFKELSDLADVNNKLQFLKSIIGVN